MGELQPEKNSGYTDTTQGRGHERVILPMRKVVLNNFLGGLAWGVGTVLGATLIVGIIILILNRLSALPGIGNFFINILNDLQHTGVR